MTSEERQQIRERVEKASQWPAKTHETFTDGHRITVGPFTVLVDPPNNEVRFQRLRDAFFVAHAREDLLALLAEVDRLEKERDEAKMLLEHAVTMVSAPLDRMIVDFLAAPSSPGRERE